MDSQSHLKKNSVKQKSSKDISSKDNSSKDNLSNEMSVEQMSEALVLKYLEAEGFVEVREDLVKLISTNENGE